MKYYGFKSVAKFPRSNNKRLGFAVGSIAQAITQLFANNEQGFVFDFNDLSTMYQDAAGTVPVTGVGQPVGKVLDKSGRGNHATQSTSAKRPILQQNATTGAYYLAFDGVDDCLVINSINFSNTNSVTIFGGVVFNNLSGNSQFVVELSNDSWENKGTFSLWRGYSGIADYALRRNITSNYPDDLRANNDNKNTAVVTGVIDSNKNTEFLRNLGRIKSSKTLEVTTNNFKTYPLYIGGGSAGYLNGQLYSLIGLSRVATTTEITNAENAIAKNVGVTL